MNRRRGQGEEAEVEGEGLEGEGTMGQGLPISPSNFPLPDSPLLFALWPLAFWTFSLSPPFPFPLSRSLFAAQLEPLYPSI